MMGEKTNTVEIPENYTYLMGRTNFERIHSIDNAAFMLSRHLEDADASYLDSDEWHHLVDKAYDCVEQSNLTMMGIVMALLGEENYPDHFEISRDMQELLYQTYED